MERMKMPSCCRLGGPPLVGQGTAEPYYVEDVVPEICLHGAAVPSALERARWEALLDEALRVCRLPVSVSENGEALRQAHACEFDLKLATARIAAFQQKGGARNFLYLRSNGDLYVRVGGPFHRGYYPETEVSRLHASLQAA